jgi:hypothetical protein
MAGDSSRQAEHCQARAATSRSIRVTHSADTSVSSAAPSITTTSGRGPVSGPSSDPAKADSAAFYQRNFFEPLGATIGRTPTAFAADDVAPEAARPIPEVNTAKEREALAAAAPKQE